MENKDALTAGKHRQGIREISAQPEEKITYIHKVELLSSAVPKSCTLSFPVPPSDHCNPTDRVISTRFTNNREVVYLLIKTTLSRNTIIICRLHLFMLRVVGVSKLRGSTNQGFSVTNCAWPLGRLPAAQAQLSLAASTSAADQL